MTKEVSTDWKAAMAKELQAQVAKTEDYDGIPHISLRHGRMSLNDKPIPNDEIECIVLDSRIERTWYDRPFDPEDKEPPNCFALGSKASDLAPDEAVPNPPSDKCKGCAWAEFGTALQGKGPACKTRLRLLVTPFGAKTTPETLKDPDLAIIKVSPTSVANYNGLGGRGKEPGYERKLALDGKVPWSVVTKVKVAPHDKKMHEVTFDLVKPITDQKIMSATHALFMENKDELSQGWSYDDPEEGDNSTESAQSGDKTSAKF